MPSWRRRRPTVDEPGGPFFRSAWTCSMIACPCGQVRGARCQVSPVAFSTMRMISSASRHSWMWARMRSSRW